MTAKTYTKLGNPILFTADSERDEYEKYAVPELRYEVEQFVDWSVAHSLPIPVVTCCGRTPKGNANTPGAVANSGHLLDPEHGDTAFEALDLRVRHYSPEGLKMATTYWTIREEVTEKKVRYVHNLNHGTAPHLHVQVYL
jgi:hypothetical protein